MCLTHAGATPEERVPYIGSLFSGTPVCTVFGRHAHSDPRAPPRQCVHFGWKDVLLPMMLDDQFPPDTLFLVFEEDWRLFSGFPYAVARTQLDTVTTSSLDREQVAAMMGEPSASLPEPLLQDVTGIPAPRSGAAVQNRFLKDIVAMANQAAKQKVGDVVWYSWMTRGKIHPLWPPRPTFGSTLLGVTKAGAQWISEHLRASGIAAETHFDVWLVRQLYDHAKLPADEQSIGASFIRPTVGAFDEHASGCQPNIGRRPAQWDCVQVQEGTRADDDARGIARNIIKWPQYMDSAKKEVAIAILPSCRMETWWLTYTRNEETQSLMRAAFFRPDGWYKLADHEQQRHFMFRNMKYIVPREVWAAHQRDKMQASRSRKRRRTEQVPEPESAPAPPQATERMRRNKRKNFMVSLLHRVWVKNPAAPLTCEAPNTST